jgi:hypothetical protein
MNTINKLFILVKKRGFKNVIRVLYNRYLGKYFNRKIKGIKFIQELFNEKNGIKIGGPSGIFQDY